MKGKSCVYTCRPCFNGDRRLAVHVYTANTSMGNKAFASQDGDFLILPQQGRLDIQTELGRMMVRPGELCVIPRGIRFKVSLPDGPVRGCELFVPLESVEN